MIAQQSTVATATTEHDGKYANGNTVPEKEDDKPATLHGEGEALVGRSIIKKFKRTKYSGKVAGYDQDCKWYKVVYDDGDEEELEYKELGPLLVEAGEAEAVKVANASKRATPETDSDSKSSAKNAKGRKSAAGKKPAKDKLEKKTKTPKSPKLPKKATSKKSEDDKQEASESHSSEEKNATEQTTLKRGRGRPKKDASSKTPASKTKGDGKGSGDSSLESKPSTRKVASEKDRSESESGRSPRGRGAVSPAGGSVSQKEGTQLIGAKTRKKFDGVFYDGEVIGYDPKVKFYKIRYSDGDNEELTLKELKKTLMEEDLTVRKIRGRSKNAASPGKAAEESPQKKQKLLPSKKEAAKAPSPARDGIQPRKRGRPAKAKSAAEATDEDEASNENTEGIAEDNSGLSGDTTSTSIEPTPYSTLLAAVRYASAYNADNLEYYGWGEVVGSFRTRCLDLAAIKLKPTASPIVHLAVSQHHLAALTASGQVLVWRNQHGNIRSRCDGWEYISDLESKGVVLIDISGPDVDRRVAGYAPEQEDQVPDPFYLVAVTCNGEDYLLQGSHPQEPVHTRRLGENPKIKGLGSTISQLKLGSLKSPLLVLQASMGTVGALDETPFVGYITDAYQVYIRAATKDYMDEVNLVSGYTGKPFKIQCGGIYHAILLTDDGRAWTWGDGYHPSSTSNASTSKNGDQSPYSLCHLALGTLVGQKVVDVGCCGEDFVALTSDGAVHHWTHGVANPAADIYNTPSTPAAGQGPSIHEGDKLKSVSAGVGMCAGVTQLGRVHTWRALWRGVPLGLKAPGTPLGHDSGMSSVIPSLGTKFAIQVMCVAGSLIVVAEKKPKAKPGSKK
ncbi:uncharacterized protein [Physcomitrium patens]|nr:uncharacterized protein LOC112294574 isoform X2 [Physcomitrium patens]XP_024400951.1 uncharacterized protein LOC112294574 isoform X2 [Physcomitrium patens]XP_024400953.1 uncharacterized protein LOC112294574 isoform X2 [Physcomitrium patens]XP_024400954.1 uncharacterized protein LOC112294574 isoform X2 [Physcomitrium patens]|eukprot:XP_024400950.1 uncharacterized protein LOC112294574 isoform X2 [Physcomitrella patens]